MKYSKEDLRQIFQKPFDREAWRGILRNLFREAEIRREDEEIETLHEDERGWFLGQLTTSDNGKYKIGLFRYDVPSVRKRVGLRKLVHSYVNERYGEFDAALVVFNSKDAWRVSFICDIKINGEATAPKRYTFVFGDSDKQYKTAVERFLMLQKSKMEFEDIKNAFSVEALSKEFFERYKEHYSEFVAYMCNTPEIFDEFAKVAQTISKGDTEKAIRDFVKRQLGRIVFLHFLQKKGWLGVPKGNEWGTGDKQFMQHLFEKASGSQKDNFLSSVLVPLYRDALDTDRSGNNDLFDTGVEGIGVVRVPYLNGGLFECGVLDAHEWKLPKELFANLLEMFSQYNFTIDENDPDDAEVGVDPEMLGRIFENLLEDNKDKGAYYTPKEIVRYMCRESLIAYLQTDLEEVDKEKVRKFVMGYDAEVLGELKETIDQKLKDVKICDPAIGSGAFPMGLLRELFFCRTSLEPEIVCNAAEIKREIIQNNIYGVDIEYGAVEIARLRFWLSLIVDEKSPATLPNLDFKIMQGNSLMEGYRGIDLSTLLRKEITNSLSIFEDNIDNIRKQLYDKINEYYGCTHHIQRDNVRKEIVALVRKQIEEKGDDGIIKKDVPIDANSDFFLWHTWFLDVFEKGGFDIVIGNPPYIQLQKNKSELGNLYENCGYETFIKKGDIYCLFYERGYQLLKEGGYLCYITSNKWLRSGYGEKTRGFLAKKTNPIILLDFAGVKVFPNAEVNPNILLFAKAANEHKTLCAVAIEQNTNILSNLSKFMEQQGKYRDFPNSDSWLILSPIEEEIKRKIEAVGTPLKEWDIKINRGVLTGCNRAFFLSTEQRNKILSNCATEEERKRTEELIRPILTGEDIKRYGYEWANLWIINTHNGLKRKLPRINIEDYPAVKDWLDNGGVAYNGEIYKGFEEIKRRADKGDTPYNLRNCAYWEDFSKPKIIYGQFQDSAEYTFDESGMYLSSNEYFIICNNYSAKCLLAFLNSKAMEWLLDKNTNNLSGNSKIAQKSNFLEMVVPILDDTTVFDSMVEKRIKGECTDKEIDELIYRFYKLTHEEIESIESTTA